MDATRIARRLWQRLFTFLEAGFEVMARYPYDLTELHWDTGLYEPPDDGEEPRSDDFRRPARWAPGRTIKVIPTPASQRYQSAQPARIPARRSRRKQSV
jgi:hypothetical protein